jgi:hypothetical protein
LLSFQDEAAYRCTQDALYALLDAVESTKLPRNEFKMLEIFFTEALEKLGEWKGVETTQRQQLQFELRSHLLIHRNLMEGFEYIKRK